MAKKKIDNIKFNIFDDRMLDFLGKFHCADKEHIKKYCRQGNRSISDKRLKMFIKRGYIETDKIKIKGEVVQIYLLGDKGIRYIKGVHRNTTSKAYKSNSKKHDFMQMKAVMENYDVELIRDYYKSEFELEKPTIGSKESRTDGAFIFDDDRQNIYIETITQYYKNDMKLYKSRYAQTRNGKYVSFKVTI